MTETNADDTDSSGVLIIDGKEYNIEIEVLESLAESGLPVAPYAERLLELAENIDHY